MLISYAPMYKYYAFSVCIMSGRYEHWQLLNSISMNCVLSLGRRHNVETRNPIRQTREKVCVWCVFESHTHSVRVQKLSRWDCFETWCPGAESNHRHEDFQSTALPLSYPGTESVNALGDRVLWWRAQSVQWKMYFFDGLLDNCVTLHNIYETFTRLGHGRYTQRRYHLVQPKIWENLQTIKYVGYVFVFSYHDARHG